MTWQSFLITTISSMQVKATHATKREKIEKKFQDSLVRTNSKSCHSSTQKVSFVGGYPHHYTSFLEEKVCKHISMFCHKICHVYLHIGKCGPIRAASIFHLKRHAHGLPKWVRIQCLRLIPLGADPGRLGDRGGIGGGAPFRPPVIMKVALEALSLWLIHSCLNLVGP